MTDNQQLADRLHEFANLLEQQGADRFRIGAYRRAAQTLSELETPVAVLHRQQGVEGLLALPGIGPSIALAIIEMLETGHWIQLERLRRELSPEQVFQSVPGVGPKLAKQIHQALGVDTLEALEVAAHDGRIERVPGVGPGRAAMIRAALDAMLSRRRAQTAPATEEPPVEMILAVDRTYRQAAAAGRLRTIAPRRFNPEGKAWLPILETDRGAWHFTALYSNTARAHELGRVHDWVVIRFRGPDHGEGQRTVVTETFGPLAGRRVVRGREGECRAYYAARDTARDKRRRKSSKTRTPGSQRRSGASARSDGRSPHIA